MSRGVIEHQALCWGRNAASQKEANVQMTKQNIKENEMMAAEGARTTPCFRGWKINSDSRVLVGFLGEVAVELHLPGEGGWGQVF